MHIIWWGNVWNKWWNATSQDVCLFTFCWRETIHDELSINDDKRVVSRIQNNRNYEQLLVLFSGRNELYTHTLENRQRIQSNQTSWIWLFGFRFDFNRHQKLFQRKLERLRNCTHKLLENVICDFGCCYLCSQFCGGVTCASNVVVEVC